MDITEETSPFSFKCNGSHINVNKEWLLPLPIAAPYSTVSYEFCTENGDINFSIAFISIDGDEEIVVYPERVCSDIETISGSCQLNCAGTLVFMWDNSYSWFTNKLLTYIVNIEQDPVPDELNPRIIESKQQLEDNRRQLTKLQKRLSGVSSVISSISVTEITELENMILKLRNQLTQKKRILKASIAEKRELVASIQTCETNRRGLYIRTLNNYELRVVLSYLDRETVACVCKLWRDVLHCDDVQDQHYVASDYAPTTLLQTTVERAESKEKKKKVPRSNSSETKAAPDKTPAEIVLDTSAVEVLSSLSEDKPHSSNNGEIVKTTESEKTTAVLRSPTSRPYRSEVIHYVKGSLDSMKDMEAEKNDIKRKISSWKHQFEKRYGRPPSDEEKIKNIPELFQRFSMINRIFTKEEARVMAIAQSLDKIEKKSKTVSSSV
mmetsp:Transcript_9341/g.14086  ORF Transcript_9341/g.14086 Transcript_9341/m.14086 type:complete len:438 (+) Transcript_9341:199-1512(+)